MITDTLGDTLIRIKNGYLASKSEVVIPVSNIAEKLIQVLQKYGYVEDYKKNEINDHPCFIVYLFEKDKKTFTDLKLVSTPGRRIYVSVKQIPYVQSGFGISILSTSKGIMSGREARKLHLGGELLATIW